jgi:hypothetical protein
MSSPSSNNKKFMVVININIIIESIEIKELKDEGRLIRKYYINFMNPFLTEESFLQFECF